MNPERTCVACRKKNDKTELIRFVKTPDGHITPDIRCRMNGRGAYVCRDEKCIEKALKGILFRRLKADLSNEDVSKIKAEFEAL